MAKDTQHRTPHAETRPAAALAALRGGAAVAPVTDRAFLRVTGPDAARWLNGMVTNAVQTLAPGEGCYNFLLNAQGRIQGDGTVYREAGAASADFLLATSGAQADEVRRHLEHFIIMDDVELTPAYADGSGLIVLGPEAPSVLSGLGLPALDPLRMAHADTEHGPVLLFRPPEGSVPRFEMRSSGATLQGLRAAMDLAEATPEAMEQLRILEAQPLYGRDIRDRDLPQETGQRNALHFAKGCYLGQEIVERIRSRGQVHREFTAFRLSGALPTGLPAPLECGGKPSGEITSAAMVPLAEGPVLLALGYARREALGSREPLTYEGGIAVPRHVV